MSDNRKHYYLKLKENYFDEDAIVLLESMQAVSYTHLVAFALSLGFLPAAYFGGAVGTVFSPVGFGDKSRPADRAPFPASPV